jgi:hypothetical protein
MQIWAVLFLLSGQATSSITTIDQIVGEYEGRRSLIDTTLTWKLSIHSNGTCRSVFTGRFMLRSSVLEGPVAVKAGRVTLECTVSPETEKLIPISWGNRLYLIEDSDADQFIRDVVRGYEPRASSEGSHLLRVGDSKVRVWGRPEVPEAWQKEFPPDNFSTRVARQLAYHRAEIDAGSRDGLAAGMLLTLYSHKHGATDLRVVSVTAGTAVIENKYGDPPLTKGTRVYSRIPDTLSRDR